MCHELAIEFKTTIHETEELLNLLVDNCKGWLQIIKLNSIKYVKKTKDDMSEAKQAIEDKIKTERAISLI